MEYYEYYNRDYINSLPKRKKKKGERKNIYRLVYEINGREVEEVRTGGYGLLVTVKKQLELSGNFVNGKLRII